MLRACILCQQVPLQTELSLSVCAFHQSRGTDVGAALFLGFKQSSRSSTDGVLLWSAKMRADS